ncbi:DUF4041 domain-containing protein [Dichelobacter nodosus]|uniref:Bacteriophage T5 Orf172 DNA-binding domain-containing protein n=1 Tax=Dichelobacter nodosus (strain VCS1703A) TaxID=246195 RepID=A5EUX5_DICNV|nr:DUF4041 domain-containing protein [Dichelobacter nodosus]ABQ13316.1 conserved hypothetical protein [Dichelobacter nodosus VCS1703A]
MPEIFAFIVFAFLVLFIISAPKIGFFIFKKSRVYKKLTEDIEALEEQEDHLNQYLSSLHQKIKEARQEEKDARDELSAINHETQRLQEIKQHSEEIEAKYARLAEEKAAIERIEQQRKAILAKIALYSGAEFFIDYGLYPLPSYSEFTAGGYLEQIKDNRQQQKNMLKDGSAYRVPENFILTGDGSYDKKVATAQGKLLVRSFNSECDYLLAKLNSRNYETTMTRIEQLAESLEKMLVSLEIGLTPQYVMLKMKECKLYYQYQAAKELEAEEQRAIKEKMREDAQAQKEIERALREAEREELIAKQAVERLQKEMLAANEEQKAQYEAQLKNLQAKLAEAETKGKRALSMAQQTRSGHVYIISNIGSFGKDVYKIGMTRRLEPLDRVRELGDASVPFSFDVHAMIYSADAPALESSLHERFADYAVNKVNKRKEFFRLPLNEIKRYLEEEKIQAQWTLAAEAVEYRQSLQITKEKMN